MQSWGLSRIAYRNPTATIQNTCRRAADQRRNRLCNRPRIGRLWQRFTLRDNLFQCGDDETSSMRQIYGESLFDDEQQLEQPTINFDAFDAATEHWLDDESWITHVHGHDAVAHRAVPAMTTGGIGFSSAARRVSPNFPPARRQLAPGRLRTNRCALSTGRCPVHGPWRC